MYLGRGEVEDTPNISFRYQISDLLCLCSGCSDDNDIYMSIFGHLFQLIGVEYLYRLSHPFGESSHHRRRVYIKGGDDLIILLEEFLVKEEGRSQITDTDDCQTPLPIQPQDGLDIVSEVFDIITNPPDTEFSKIGQVFAHLCGVYPAGACEVGRGDDDGDPRCPPIPRDGERMKRVF